LNPEPKSSAFREAAERLHYNAHAAAIAGRDLIPSNRIARQYRVREMIEPLLQKRNGSLGTVLDIGCGFGVGALYMEGCFDRYIGYDLSEEMIAIGRDFARDLPNVELDVGNAKDFTLPGEVADHVFVWGSLHHMPEADVAVKNIYRMLKPGGWVVAQEPRRGNPLFGAMRAIRMMVDRTYSENQEFYSREELCRMFASARFEEITTRAHGYLIPPLSLVVLKPQWIFKPLAQAAAKLDSALASLLPNSRLSWNLTIYAQRPLGD
jgi:ubiquinone/menaquinone biosynthesis C-methylase UbiE